MNSLTKAYNLYARHIYDEEKIALLTSHNFKVPGSVPSVMWELFGAILTGRSGAGNTGADLLGWEVKSAQGTGSYEYQYHLNTGLEKLREDCEVNHLFCNYSESYQNVMVKAMKGADLANQYFKKWKPAYIKNYDTLAPKAERRQRFRRSIGSGYVASSGVSILEIESGKLKFTDAKALEKLNRGF